MLKLYVGNLSYDCTDSQLRDLFSSHGDVSSAQIVIDRETGRSRGFGFVEMSNDADGRKAMEALNGAAYGGRNLTVNEARARESRGGGGGGGGGGGYRGGGGGGGGYRGR